MCSFPAAYGYKMDGNPKNTTLGQSIDLQRLNKPGQIVEGSPHIEQLTVEIEELRDDMLRVVVSILVGKP